MNLRSSGVDGLTFSQCTHRGLLRKSNEDCCGAAPAHGAFVVCDGMGGAAAGEVASHLAVETFLEACGAAMRRGSAKARLAEAVRAANAAVYRRARGTSGLDGMGTTLVAALLEGKRDEPDGGWTLWIAHVGDSRCYLLRGGRLRLLTGDHSVVEEQVRAGLMTRGEAEVSPVRHVITRAIGSQGTVEPEIQTVDVYPGDLLLLTTDGLNRELSDEDIERLLAGVPTEGDEEALRIACQSLIDAANAHGGRDNVTVLLVRIG